MENVFVKEDGFAVEKFISDNIDELNDLNIRFVFLYRHVHESVISFWKASGNNAFPGFSHILGYAGLLNTLKIVSKHPKHSPIGVRSEDLYNNPTETLRKLCSELDIPFSEKQLAWKPLGDRFAEEWLELKTPSKAIHWHQKAIDSCGFEKPTSYELDPNGVPTFEEVEDLEQKNLCKQTWMENLPLYEEIDAHFSSGHPI